MIEIKRLPEFDEWLDGIKDNMTRIRLNRRLDKVQRGNWGDIKPFQDGVWEMREFFGSGWRMYYIQHGDVVIVMLGGGDKSTQQQDRSCSQIIENIGGLKWLKSLIYQVLIWLSH